MADVIVPAGEPSLGGSGQPAVSPESLSSVMAGAAGAKPKEEAGNGGTEGGTGTGSEVPVWHEQLPKELKGKGELAGYQSVGDMAKAYLELKGKAATEGLVLPGKDAKPEEVTAFWEKLGRPKTADEYSFAKEKDAEVIVQIAHKANLTEAQAQTMYTQMKQFGAYQAEAAQKAQSLELAETEAKLKGEYGARYPEKIELLRRGLLAAGQGVAEALQKAGISGNPEIVKAFIQFGEMTSESGGARGKNAAQPLKPSNEGGWYDYKKS